MAYKLYKTYPDNFSEDIISIVNTLSIKSGKKAQLYGSSRFKLDYPSDYDLYQEVKLTDKMMTDKKLILKEFQEVITNLLSLNDVFIGDIKSGIKQQLKVIDDDINENNYNEKIPIMKKKLKSLYYTKRITKEEYDNSIVLLRPDLKETALSLVRHAIRFEIIRWKPVDILNGFTTYRGYKIKFTDYLFTDSITKIDVLCWVNGIRFTEITMVYGLTYKNKILNQGFQNLDKKLIDTIPVLLSQGKFLKICKRINSIERLKKEPTKLLLSRLYRLFNSDLGNLSQIISDLTVLEYLIENKKNIPIKKMKYEIDMMKYRLGNMTNKKYLKHQETVLMLINDIELGVIDAVIRLKDYLNNILQSETLKVMKLWKIFPIPKEYLPQPEDKRGTGLIVKPIEDIEMTI
jgi:hypothetical protein